MRNTGNGQKPERMTAMKYCSYISTVTIFIALISVMLQAYLASNDLQKLTTILRGLAQLEHSNVSALVGRPKIAIGYGSCSDLYVRATRFLNYTDYPVDGNEFRVDDVNSERELIHSFGHYFKNGAAAERYTSDKEFFRRLIRSAESKTIGEVRWSLGGNAPVMGSRFFHDGADVLLATEMTKKLQDFLPSGIRLTGDPIDEDDIHLIMEYKTGEKWGPYTAPRANRYILHSDQNNPHVSSLEKFQQALETFRPRLLVISGLQMMDSYPFVAGVREERLSKVTQQINSQSNGTLVHFEMASYVEIKLLRLLLEQIIPYSDSIGLNEQELDNLNQVMERGQVTFASESNPRVATALNQMRRIFKEINFNYFQRKGIDKSSRMLTRIHVHTLAYQAILIVKDSEWRNTKNAAAKAALTAHRHVCGTNIVNPDQSNLILDASFSTSPHPHDDERTPKRIAVDAADPVPCWSESLRIDQDMIDVEICVAPVLVCKVAKQTAGAGDNISAAGLILQI